MPQTIMLAVHCKKSEPVELKGPIVQYVKRTYGDQARKPGFSQSAAARTAPPSPQLSWACMLWIGLC